MIGTTTACSTTPLELPNWSELEVASTEAVHPIPLPGLETDLDGNVTALSLQSLLIAAKANTEIAEQNALALQALSGAYNDVIDAGRHQRDYAMIREEQLELERQDHQLDNLFHRTVIALLALGLAL